MVLASSNQLFPLNKSGICRVYIYSYRAIIIGFTLPRKVLWGSKIAKEPPLVLYDEVVCSEYGVYKWLSKIVSRTLDLCCASP